MVAAGIFRPIDRFASIGGTDQPSSVLGTDRFYIYFIDLAADVFPGAWFDTPCGARSRRGHNGISVRSISSPKAALHNDARDANNGLVGQLGGYYDSVLLLVLGKYFDPFRSLFKNSHRVLASVHDRK